MHPRRGVVQWNEPLEVEIRFTHLKVGSDGTWGTTPWDLYAFCFLDGCELDLQQPEIWKARRVSDGKSYDLNWVSHVAVAGGSRLECGVQGTLSDHVTRRQDIAEAKMREPVVIDPKLGKHEGQFEAKDQKTSYTVSYSFEVLD